MTVPDWGLAALTLPLWGAAVSLDERGIWFGGFAHPWLAGAVAGVWVGEPGLGLWIGCLFQAIWPVRVESGGNIYPAGGLAAVGATAAAATLGVPGVSPATLWLDWVGTSSHSAPEAAGYGGYWLATAALALALAGAGSTWESSLRSRNRGRETRALRTVPSMTGIRRATLFALAEAGARGVVLVAIPLMLGAWGRQALGGRSPVDPSALDRAAIWLLPSFLALGLGGLSWRLRRPRTAVLDWGLGLALGGAAAILLGTLR